MSGTKPLSVLSLIAAAILALSATQNFAVAQENADEVDCESVCRVFPERAPPECSCEAQIVGGASGAGAGAEYADPEVRELHERVQESWREMTADVEDYTVVQTASVVTENGPMQLGPPVVMHFEKEWIEGYPMYRFVSPAELSNREQVARGEPTAGQVGGAMSQAIGLIGGALAGAAGDAGVGGSGEAGESTGGFTLPREWSEELAELGQLMNNLDEAAEMETREDLADELASEFRFWQHANKTWEGPCRDMISQLEMIGLLDSPWEVPEDECVIVAIRGSDFEEGELTSLMGGEFDDYQLEEARMLIMPIGQPFGAMPVAMIAELVAPSGEQFRVQRVSSAFATETPAEFVPQTERMTMSNASALMGQAVQEIQGIIDDVYVVIHQLRKILVNDGPPTREQIAQLIAEFAGEMGPGAGFPGS